MASLSGMLALAGAARLATLGLRQVVEGDGVHYSSLARQALAGDLSGLANPYWSDLWPAVIAGVAALTGLDVVGAARLASLVCGVLLVAAGARFGERVFGSWLAGTLTGLAIASHAWLIQFSTLAFTESLFALLVVLAIDAIWGAVVEPCWWRLIAAGILVGLGWLTRPEALALAGVGAVALAIARYRRKGLGAALTGPATFLLVIGLFIGLRALAIRHYYGEWDFGQTKGVANLLVGLAETDVEREESIRGVTPSGESPLEIMMKEWSLTRFVTTQPRRLARHLLHNALLLGDALLHVFPPLPMIFGARECDQSWFGRLLLLLAAVCFILAMGGFAVGLRRATRPALWFVSAALSVYLAGVGILLVHDRLVVAMTPLFLILLGGGAAALLSWVGNWLGPHGRWITTAVTWSGFIILAVVTVSGLRRQREAPYAYEPLSQKEAGLWLRAHFPQTKRLMTAAPIIAFYFYDATHQEGEVDIPWAGYSEVMAAAHREKADLVAAHEWQLRSAGFPAAGDLTPNGQHPGLVHVTTITTDVDRQVHIFRVVPPADVSPVKP